MQHARRRLQADGAADRWARGPQFALPIVAALKDLGVAQGFGKPAKELQAARSKTAFSRLELVARLGLPRKALSRLVSASSLVAGMYGSACHVYDSDFLSSLRNWVMHALYRGSRFAQVRLFMHLVLPSPLADPWQVALRKGWAACELVRQEWGEEVFWRVWDRSTKDGPLCSFKQLLAQLPQPQQPLFQPRLPLRPAVGHSLADSFRAGGPFWRNRGSAVQVLTKALQVHDLEWVGRHRSGLQAAGQIDVGLARRLSLKLPVKGMREASESVPVRAGPRDGGPRLLALPPLRQAPVGRQQVRRSGQQPVARLSAAARCPGCAAGACGLASLLQGVCLDPAGMESGRALCRCFRQAAQGARGAGGRLGRLQQEQRPVAGCLRLAAARRQCRGRRSHCGRQGLGVAQPPRLDHHGLSRREADVEPHPAGPAVGGQRSQSPVLAAACQCHGQASDRQVCMDEEPPVCGGGPLGRLPGGLARRQCQGRHRCQGGSSGTGRAAAVAWSLPAARGAGGAGCEHSRSNPAGQAPGPGPHGGRQCSQGKGAESPSLAQALAAEGPKAEEAGSGGGQHSATCSGRCGGGGRSGGSSPAL